MIRFSMGQGAAAMRIVRAGLPVFSDPESFFRRPSPHLPSVGALPLRTLSSPSGEAFSLPVLRSVAPPSVLPDISPTGGEIKHIGVALTDEGALTDLPHEFERPDVRRPEAWHRRAGAP